MNLKALAKINYGVYVVCSKKDGKYNGQIVNSIFQVTSDPPTVAISINKRNFTHEYINASRIFTISVLSKNTPLNFIGLFGFKSGRDIDKFNGVNYKLGRTGARVVLENTVSYIEVVVISSLEVETHTIFVGKVVDAEILKEDEPMTYSYYHDIKRGTTPVTAPTYMKQSPAKKEGRKMTKYVCKVCGYIYDPEKGDPDGNIEPGTSFEDLPESWVCPVCGAAKDQFEPES